DAAKIITTVNTEREHILADARDDARQIIEAAHETAAESTLPPEFEAIILEAGEADAHLDSMTAAVETSDDVDAHATTIDDEWFDDLERIFDDDTSAARGPPAEPPQTR